MKKIIPLSLMVMMVCGATSVKATTPVELALIGSVAGLGSYAKDIVEGVRQQLKTEKGRRQVLSWIRDCGLSCWHVCAEPSFAEQFIPKRNIESDMHRALVCGMDALEKMALERAFHEAEEMVEFILPRPQASVAENSALLRSDKDVDPIYYVAFIRREGRQIPQDRLANWADNGLAFKNQVVDDLKDLSMSFSESALTAWIHDGNLAELQFIPSGIKIKDPVMTYAIGGVSGGFRPSEMSAPLLMVTIRGKIPVLQAGTAYTSLLSQGEGESKDDWKSRLQSQAPDLYTFKTHYLESILNPPKRSQPRQVQSMEEEDPFV
jgi:hypothetical protein